MHIITSLIFQEVMFFVPHLYALHVEQKAIILLHILPVTKFL